MPLIPTKRNFDNAELISEETHERCSFMLAELGTSDHLDYYHPKESIGFDNSVLVGIVFVRRKTGKGKRLCL